MKVLIGKTLESRNSSIYRLRSINEEFIFFEEDFYQFVHCYCGCCVCVQMLKIIFLFKFLSIKPKYQRYTKVYPKVCLQYHFVITFCSLLSLYVLFTLKICFFEMMILLLGIMGCLIFVFAKCSSYNSQNIFCDGTTFKQF